MEWERRRMSQEEENGTGEENGVLKWTPLFDKAVTPSDVGKLNRLVIPKQQAEKYFPMEVHSNDKGLLLTFHDTAGKPWRFRYSYWNSSQSYVLTKGWSRFVKDKRLVAGDIVSFHRGTSEARQLYIACRSRPLSLKQPAPPVVKGFGFPSATACYNPHWMQVFWPRLGHMEGLVCPAADPVAVSRPQMNGDAEEPRAKRKEVRVFGVDLAVSRSPGGPVHFPS